MARTMQQSRITFVIRLDLLEQATAESEASTLTMAELVRRAIDLYLTQFPPPEVYETGELLGEQTNADGSTSYPANKKYSIHINDGLLGELDRYAGIVHQAPDEVVNRALMLYAVCLKARREAAEALDIPPDASSLDELEDESSSAVSPPEDEVVDLDALENEYGPEHASP